MRYTNLIFTIIFSTITISCNKSNIKNNEETESNSLSQLKQQESDSVNEERIYKLIYNLPEVVERAKYIEKETQGKRHLVIMIAEKPKEKTQNYYWVKVGENLETNFVTHYNFYVYKEKYEIKYYDTVNDTIINLETWRKNNIQ